MIEIVFHGRGGQGAVTSAELTALAAINEGRYAQAFPSFGPERRGAPVMAFARVDDKKIRIRSKIYTPNVVLVLDPSLLKILDPTAGMDEDGVLILNSHKSAKEIKDEFGYNVRMAVIDADKIAKEEVGRPIANTTMLGAMIKATELVDLSSLIDPLEHRFDKKLADKNISALKRAHSETNIVEKA